MLATKPRKGLLIVHTGKGKGKSTATFGWSCVRSARHAIGIIQFVKGNGDRQRDVLDKFPTSSRSAITKAYLRSGPRYRGRQCGLGRRKEMIDASRGDDQPTSSYWTNSISSSL